MSMCVLPRAKSGATTRFNPMWKYGFFYGVRTERGRISGRGLTTTAGQTERTTLWTSRGGGVGICKDERACARHDLAAAMSNRHSSPCGDSVCEGSSLGASDRLAHLFERTTGVVMAVLLFRDTVYMLKNVGYLLLYLASMLIRMNRRIPLRYVSIVSIFSQRLWGSRLWGALLLLSGHLVLSHLHIRIPAQGPCLVLFLIRNGHTHCLIHDEPVTSRKSRLTQVRQWVSPSKMRKFVRGIISAHKLDRGHREISKARFKRAVRIVRKERGLL
jgi:hypothetical protein